MDAADTRPDRRVAAFLRDNTCALPGAGRVGCSSWEARRRGILEARNYLHPANTARDNLSYKE